MTYLKKTFERSQTGCFKDSDDSPATVAGLDTRSYDNIGSMTSRTKTGFKYASSYRGQADEPVVTATSRSQTYRFTVSDESGNEFTYATITDRRTLSSPMNTKQFWSNCVRSCRRIVRNISTGSAVVPDPLPWPASRPTTTATTLGRTSSA